MRTSSTWPTFQTTISNIEMTVASPRLRFVLLLSLALNCALLAALGLIWWHHHPVDGGYGGVVRMPQMQILEQVMPGTDHAALHAAYARLRPDVHARFSAVLRSKEAVRQALGAEPFDPQALARALEAMRADEQGIATVAHALLVEVASQTSAEGRQALARIVTSRRLWHGHERHRHGHQERDQAKAELNP